MRKKKQLIYQDNFLSLLKSREIEEVAINHQRTGGRGFLTSSTSSFQRTDEVDRARADADENMDVQDSIYGMECFSRKKKKGKGSLVWGGKLGKQRRESRG